MSKKRIAIILGARPNFVKVAPLTQRVKEYPGFELVLIHTGQHFDENMSKVFFDQMGIPKPDIMLHIEAEFHTEKIGKMFSSLMDIFHKEKFDAAIVVGDVNSTLAGALAAAKNNCRLIHIEAGLRSHDRRMPEEINRVIVDHLSELLYTTEEQAVTNLLKEGIPPAKIHPVGNLMIESLELYQPNIQASTIISELTLEPKQYIVATIHRVENTDSEDSLRTILNILNKINETTHVVFPLHPGTKQKINNLKLSYLLEPLQIIDPLGYFDFMKLVTDSAGVVTDSGGIQEETSHLGIPCCSLRDNTERPVTLTLGSNKLFPISIEAVPLILEHLARQDFQSRAIPMWDGGVSQRIFDSLGQNL